MLLLAVDAGVPAPDLRAVLLEHHSRLRADRVLLFGEAARQVSADLLVERSSADERFLDEAARYVLHSGEALPARAPDDALASLCIAVAHGDAQGYAPLMTTERAMEMAGRLIVMALPEVAALDEEDLDNAAVWIAGGGGRRLEERDRRPVLVPGDFATTGVVLAVELASSRVVARALDRSGRDVESKAFALHERHRLSVSG